VLRLLKDNRINDEHIAAGLRNASWPARLQRLSKGALSRMLPDGGELWLDGGHNADAGVVLEQALQAMPAKPLVVIWGMLNTKDATQFFRPLAKLAQRVFTLAIPGEANAISGDVLAETVRGLGTVADPVSDLTEAVRRASLLKPAARILICGSLYLAGHVLAAEEGTSMSAVTGTARR
jgi:dihydrofolate synthase / folylpolyglutamate synthase